MSTGRFTAQSGRTKLIVAGLAMSTLLPLGFAENYHRPVGRRNVRITRRVAKPYKKKLRQAQRKARKIERMHRKRR